MVLLFGCFPAVERVLAARLARFACAAVRVMEIVHINEKPKAHILMHVPQFIANMDRPLGLASKHAVEAQHPRLDALYQSYRTSSETSFNYQQCLLQSVRYYYTMHV